MPQQPPLIAIVGSDGSGKSTVGEALLAWMRTRQPTTFCHLGKQTGNYGRAIARWPLIGRGMGRVIAKKADTARKPHGPGPVTAIAIYAFSMRRVLRFRRMLAARRHGAAVLADRFPQLGVPGPMDGLALAPFEAAGGVVGLLARRERRHYAWMVAHRPDLVIRLNVDLATAIARKPDHNPVSLGIKVADVPRLTFEGAPIVDIDATRPLVEVVERAKQAIGDMLAARER